MKATKAANSPKQVLQAAKWILENVGWIQGKSYHIVNDKYAGFCSFEAINVVVAKHNSSKSYAVATLSQFMDNTIVRFNDHPYRTKKEVLAAFERAIESLK